MLAQAGDNHQCFLKEHKSTMSVQKIYTYMYLWDVKKKKTLKGLTKFSKV